MFHRDPFLGMRASETALSYDKQRSHLYRPTHEAVCCSYERSLSSPNCAQNGAMSVALRRGNKEGYCDLLKLNTLKTYDLHRTTTVHVAGNKVIPEHSVTEGNN